MTKANSLGTILVFDDTAQHKKRYEALRDAIGCELAFVNLSKKDVMVEIQNTASNYRKADLILVDYVLDKTDNASQGQLQKGVALASIAREHWSDCPIIAVSAAYDDCVCDVSSDVFDDIAPLDELSHLSTFIPSVIDGYRKAKGHTVSVKDILKLLAPPRNDEAMLSSLIPQTVRGSLGRKECVHHLFRWMRREFYRLPGLLYDADWASILIGVKKEFFSQYRDSIRTSQYSGVFSDDEDPRWWKTSIYEAVLPESARRFSVSIQEAASEKLKINKRHFSVCYKCHEAWPDVMASVDETPNAEMRPMHLKCSTTAPNSVVRPFYEERHIMLGD